MEIKPQREMMIRSYQGLSRIPSQRRCPIRPPHRSYIRMSAGFACRCRRATGLNPIRSSVICPPIIFFLPPIIPHSIRRRGYHRIYINAVVAGGGSEAMREGALRGDRPRKFFNTLATIITPCSLNARIGTEECIMLANRSQFVTSSSVSSLARTNMNSYHIPVRFAIGASMSARRSSSPPCARLPASLRVP